VFPHTSEPPLSSPQAITSPPQVPSSSPRPFINPPFAVLLERSQWPMLSLLLLASMLYTALPLNSLFLAQRQMLRSQSWLSQAFPSLLACQLPLTPSSTSSQQRLSPALSSPPSAVVSCPSQSQLPSTARPSPQPFQLVSKVKDIFS